MVALQMQSMVRLARKAAEGGARRSSMTALEWDCSGDCSKPVAVEFWSRPPADDPKLARRRKAKAQAAFWGREFDRLVRGTPTRYSWEKPLRGKVSNGKRIVVGKGHGPGLLTVRMDVRCRKCSNCMRGRSRMWYARAMTELLSAKRTWFGTITLAPDWHHFCLSKARRNARRKSVVWEELTPDEQFAKIAAISGAELQLWLKRVRKVSGAPLRYLLVCEKHKSGLPHYHCFIHETDEMRPVSKRQLDKAWSWGFTKFKLVKDLRQAAYPVKYLSKSMLVRVRASIDYGKNALQHSSFEKTNQRETMTPSVTSLVPLASTDLLESGKDADNWGDLTKET